MNRTHTRKFKDESDEKVGRDAGDGIVGDSEVLVWTDPTGPQNKTLISVLI